MITFRMMASITKNIRPPEKIKYWNELDGSIFLSKIFSHPVEIRKIALFSLRVENDQPCVGIGFDIPEFPDNLPEKWKKKDITCAGLE